MPTNTRLCGATLRARVAPSLPHSTGGHRIVSAMADRLIAAFDRDGHAGETDLYLAGFDPAAISRHGPAARRTALVRLAIDGRDPFEPGAA